MLQDEGNRIVFNFLKDILKKLATYTLMLTKNSGKTVAKTVKDNTENHEKKNLKSLMKKYRNSGIHVEKDISTENLDKMKQALQKLKIDFVVEPSLEDINKVNIIVPSVHKQTIEYLKTKLLPDKKPKDSLTTKIANAQKVANEHNQKIAQQKKQTNVLGQDPIKHKSPTH